MALLVAGQLSLRAQAPVPADADVEQRLKTIETSLDAGARRADAWWYGWLAAYSGATIAQGIMAARVDDGRAREDLAVGAVTSLIGALGQLVFPLRAGKAARELRQLPETTAEQRRVKLAAAERGLSRAAADERFGRSWKSQLASLSVNAAAGFVTSLAFDRPARDGMVTFAVGQGVSEVQTFTQPMRAAREWEEYRRRFGADSAPASVALSGWHVRLTPASIAVFRGIPLSAGFSAHVPAGPVH